MDCWQTSVGFARGPCDDDVISRKDGVTTTCPSRSDGQFRPSRCFATTTRSLVSLKRCRVRATSLGVIDSGFQGTRSWRRSVGFESNLHVVWVEFTCRSGRVYSSTCSTWVWQARHMAMQQRPTTVSNVDLSRTVSAGQKADVHLLLEVVRERESALALS